MCPPQYRADEGGRGKLWDQSSSYLRKLIQMAALLALE